MWKRKNRRSHHGTSAGTDTGNAGTYPDGNPQAYAGKRTVYRGSRTADRRRSDPGAGDKTADGKAWWAAFTSFEEELKGGGSVKSTFLADIDKLFASALTVPEIAGVIINPWNRTIQLDKNLIQIVEGAKR